MAVAKTSLVPRLSKILSINPASILTTVTSVQTFTLTGAKTDMLVMINVPTQEFADVRIISSRISAANTLELTFFNFGASTRDQAAFNIGVVCF
jgi:hypothetical protein